MRILVLHLKDCEVRLVYLQGIDRLEKEAAGRAPELYNGEFEIFHPREVCISMKQGGMAAAKVLVAVGDHVSCGQMIGKNTSELSVPVYASMSGTVTKIWEKRQSVYEMVSHVVIRADHFDAADTPQALETAKNPLEGLKQMGIIGMLGKRRPLFLSGLYLGRVKQLCLAAFDREPMVYSDYRLIMECPAKVLFGARVMAEIFQCDSLRIDVCHEEVRYVLEKTARNYQHALRPLTQIRFYSVSGNMYQKSCAPLEKVEYGLWCSAVELCAVYDGYYDGRPMTGRGITISGQVGRHKNLWVPNGTYVRDLLEYCGGVVKGKSYVTAGLIEQEQLCVVEGGPLGGHCVDVDQACVSLTTESILVLEWNGQGTEEECLLCRSCCNACPAGLKPLHIEKALREEPQLCCLLDVDQCVECGWCSYVCPSHRRLKERVAAAKKLPARYGVVGSSEQTPEEDGRRNTLDKTPGAGGAPEAQPGIGSRFEVSGRGRSLARKLYNIEAAPEPWDYIELDGAQALAMEPLVPVSQSGPYIHGGKSTAGILGRWLLVSAVMGVIYGLVLGTGVWLHCAVAAALFGVLEWGSLLWHDRALALRRGHSIGHGVTGEGQRPSRELFRQHPLLWKQIVTQGLLTGTALSFIPSWKWLLASVAVSYIAGRTLKVNGTLAGITAVLCAYSFVSPASGPESLWLMLGWMAVWVYMIYDMLIVPWATVLFLLVFQWLSLVIGAGPVWAPMLFMGAVWFVNDYKNAGRDTPMQRTLAVFAGGICALLAAILPVGAGVCLGLLIVNIIACNLMTYTI